MSLIMNAYPKYIRGFLKHPLFKLNVRYATDFHSLNNMVAVVSKKDITFLKQKEAADIDGELFSKYGFRVDQLMELAGLAAAKAANLQYSKGRVLVLCGPGNNGGDGFVCARHMQMFGFEPLIVYPKKSNSDLMKALETQCKAMDIPVLDNLSEPASNFSLVVDAFFGFSFKPPVREPFGQIIESVVNSGVFIFSIDIPSGWHVEEGAPANGPFIKPHSVISLTAPKLCMKDWTGPHFVGGRFVPRRMIDEWALRLPVYPHSDQIVKIE